MSKEVPRRDPATQLGIPVWCHPHYSKMRASQFNKDMSLFVIDGSAAKLRITSRPTTAGGGWFVDWEIMGLESRVSGHTSFSSGELKAAFGLSEDSGKSGGGLIERFGGDSAEQGKYIRWKSFLNIPCPGTGHDGDPNISIRISEEIQDIIRQLLF